MSYFHGKQGKGAQRQRKAVLRAEAEQRAVVSPHENSKAHRLGRCECPKEG